MAESPTPADATRSTITHGADQQAGARRPRLPAEPSCDRYALGEFIGEGGMGRVYKARDPRLGRAVALKFLRNDDPRQVRRFFREARAQASLDHPHVCKVFEVGEADETPYIAMAYIDGAPLKAAKLDMTLEQKVKVVSQIAGALHAAHRSGLIHRDIKPSNIMVERSPEGGFHPYLVDFGLAREVSAPSETATALIEGTPSYMSPEQAAGREVDRRADVYSLGATLYELLCGRPPFTGSSTVEILRALEHDDPASPRRVVPTVPRDLETIALKCLEKDPGRRYDSAKALGQDLERYLNGDLISARRASVAYIALTKLRKHKALAGVSLAALLAVAAAAGASVRARLAAAEQADLAQSLGQDVKEMELLMRHAYAMPIHDVRREKARVREKMARIEARIAAMGALAEGPGHYALGRGHLALRDAKDALRHLTIAWEAGYRRPEVEVALGEALGELYRAGLEEVPRISDREARLARQRELEREYKEPALRHLREAGGGDQAEAPAYAEGLIALYDKRYDDALKKASEAAEQALWTYDVRKLEGDVHAALGMDLRDQSKTEEAIAECKRAAEAYREAREAARSDASIHEVECEMWAQVLDLEAKKGIDPRVSLEKAASACDAALRAEPESASALSKKAWAYSRWGVYLTQTKQDPRGALEEAIALGEEALRRRPRDPSALDTIGNAHLNIGFYESKSGLDPRGSFARATERFERALELHPTFAWAHNDLGGVYLTTAYYEAARGLDPRGSFDRSIKKYEAAIALSPRYQLAYTNAAMAHQSRAQHELRSGGDPRPSADKAEAFCRQSLALNPSVGLTFTILGLTELTRAQHDLLRGADLEGPLQRAIEAFQSGLALNPSGFFPYRGLADAFRLRATALLKRGEDPSFALERAREAHAKMASISADSADTHLKGAQIALLFARSAARKGEERAAGYFDQAARAVELASRADPKGIEIIETAANIRRFRAAWEVREKEPAIEAWILTPP